MLVAFGCRLFYVCIYLQLEAPEGCLPVKFLFGGVLILPHNLRPNFAEILVIVKDRIWRIRLIMSMP